MVSVRFIARSIGLMLAVALLAAGCAKQNTSETSSNASDTAVTPAVPAGPTDAEIAAIVVDYNKVEIALGEAAEKKAKSPKVKEFAVLMVKDHTGVNKKATDLATSLNLTPLENDESMKLTNEGSAFRQSLEGKSGSDFDKAYVDNEVALHQGVLDKFDVTLIPAAKDPQLKALLVEVRPAVAAHLEHAKQIQSGMTATSQATGK